MRKGFFKRLAGIALTAAIVVSSVQFSDVKAAALSNLQEKTFFFLGSSVTYGYAANGVSFADYIAQRNNCTSVKEAVSGTTLVDNGSGSYVQRMINNLNKNQHCDHFICQLSTNDASQNKPLGSLSSSYNLSDFDTSTIYGAIEYIICYAKQTWHCPVTFYTNPRYNNSNYQNMVNAIKNVQSKWGIGLINMWDDADATNIMNSSQKSTYMADDIHPNAKGYLEWWTPIFENYLQNFDYSSYNFTQANANWNDMPYWSCYQASGWAGDPSVRYKAGSSYDDFELIIDKASTDAWGIQIKTQAMETVAGSNYKCKIVVESNMATSQVIRFKEESTQEEKMISLNQGNNTLELDFTAASTAQIFFDFGVAPANLDFKITSFSLTRIVPADAFSRIEAESFAYNEHGVIDTNSNASGGFNIGGIINNTVMRYDYVSFSEAAGSIELCYSSPSGTANGNAVIYADSLDNQVATVALPNNGSNWQTYGMIKAKLDKTIEAGMHTIYIKFVTTSTQYYVANVDYFTFDTKKADLNIVSDGLEIHGYQFNYINKGMRTVYSVAGTIEGKSVTESGLVYSLADYATEDELYVGSDSGYVYNFASTSAGRVDVDVTPAGSTGYAMTMMFAGNTSSERTANWRIRAYAKLSDGSYVYTESVTYNIFSLAKKLYAQNIMPNKAAHDFLYNDVLKIVDPNYAEVAYNYRNTFAKDF